MLRVFFILAALLSFGGTAAVACTAEGGRIAAEARDDRRSELHRVRGAYNVLSVSRRSEQRYGQVVEVATYHGRITTKGGRTFDTLHEDDGSIILCAMFETPVADARGLFFLERWRGTEVRYQLIDWDGSYLKSLSASRAVRETGE